MNVFVNTSTPLTRIHEYEYFREYASHDFMNTVRGKRGVFMDTTYCTVPNI